MAINHLVAKKYASAAFNVAKKLNLVDQFAVDLRKFSDAISKSMIKELSNPAISRDDLKKIIAELGTKLTLHKETITFLEVVAEERRIANIGAIELSFAKLVKIEKNILEVEVFSAADLDGQNIQDIKTTLAKKYVGKIIEIKQSIKKDILGGLQIKIGSTMIDASLKRQLLSLNQQFQSIL
ncbi:MAG: ATP synthase F1 subunit delta [Pseudomonadota bacterium]